MPILFEEAERLTAKNRAEFDEAFDLLKFVTDDEVRRGHPARMEQQAASPPMKQSLRNCRITVVP